MSRGAAVQLSPVKNIFPQCFGTSNVNSLFPKTQPSEDTRKYQPTHLVSFYATPPPPQDLPADASGGQQFCQQGNTLPLAIAGAIQDFPNWGPGDGTGEVATLIAPHSDCHFGQECKMTCLWAVGGGFEASPQRPGNANCCMVGAYVSGRTQPTPTVNNEEQLSWAPVVPGKIFFCLCGPGRRIPPPPPISPHFPHFPPFSPVFPQLW